MVRPIGFEPMQWVRALAADEPLPTAKQLTTAAISGPGILLTQMAAIRALTPPGPGPVRHAARRHGRTLAGHAGAASRCKAKGASDAELLALLQLIGAAGSLVSRRRGMVGRGDKSPMVSVTNADPDRIAELLEEFSTDVRTVLPPVLSIRNGRRSVVITGTPEQLSRFELYCSKITEKEEAERKNKLRGGAVFSPMFARRPGRGRLPHPAAGRRRRRSSTAGPRRSASTPSSPTRWPSRSSCAPSTGSPRSSGCTTSGARWILDLGPSDTVTRLTAPVIRGLGVGIVAAATRAGQRNLFTVGAAPEVAARMVELRPVGRHAARRLGQAVDEVHPAHRALADPARRHDADDRRRQDRRRRGQRRATGPSSPAAARSPSRSSTAASPS